VSSIVKFTNPREFYQWYDANRKELLAFKEDHDSSKGLGSYVYTPTNPLTPIPPGGPGRNKHRYWNHIVKEYPLDKREDLFEEDEIYLVTNLPNFSKRNSMWWVIYIPTSLYKVNVNPRNPFQKEAWWYFRDGEIEPQLAATPDLEWISGFIKYDEFPVANRFLNYPEGGI
tara:strand:- start:77 stop:589 length:513 start_codon:yes stop_codon:yes gene_type:complete